MINPEEVRLYMKEPVTAGAVRLGVIVPSVNTVVEPWFSKVVPTGCAVHAARMFLDNKLTPEGLITMDREEGHSAVRQILSCRPRAIAYCCTASSIVQGLGYDERLNDELGAHAGVPIFTATKAINESLTLLGARRIVAVSPYSKAIDEAEHRFLTESGFEVIGSACLDITDSFALAGPSRTEIIDLVMKAWNPEADALLITCLNLNSHLVIEELEQRLDRPVVTSTQATLWKLLRAAGVNAAVPGYGMLLATGGDN